LFSSEDIDPENKCFLLMAVFKNKCLIQQGSKLRLGPLKVQLGCPAWISYYIYMCAICSGKWWLTMNLESQKENMW
jgi:hypothetical protein